MGLFDRLFRRSRPERAEGTEASEPVPGLFTARSTTVPPELAGAGPRDEDAPPPPEDLWDRPVAPDEEPEEPPEAEPVAERIPEAEPAEVAALEAFDPEPEPDADAHGHVVETDDPAPAGSVEALWDEATWRSEAADDPVATEGSTADEPLLAGDAGPVQPPAPAPAPVPPLFDPPEVVVEPDPEDLVAPEPEPEPAPAPAPEPAPESQVDDEGRTMRVHDGRLDKRPGPIRMTPSEAIALAQEGPRALRRDRPHADG